MQSLFAGRPARCLLLLLLLLSGFFFLDYQREKQRESLGRELNYAGRQRMLIERFNVQILGTSSPIDAIAQHLDLLQQTATSLLRGGVVPRLRSRSQKEPVAAARNKAIQTSLKAFLGLLSNLREASTQQALDQIRKHHSHYQKSQLYLLSRRLLRQADDVVRKMASHAEKTAALQQRRQWLGLLFIFGLCALVVWLTYSNLTLAQQRNRNLQELSEMKTAFLANVSHELRTPLNAILGYTELVLEDPGLDAQSKSDLDNVVHAGKHLLLLINDLLDLSKIQVERMQIHLEPTLAYDACEDALLYVTTQAKKKQIQLQINLPQDLPTVWVDPMRLRQILYNLLGNAIKFTPKGGTVGFRARVDGENLMLLIEDSGIGISAEAQKHIFEPFTQASNTTTKTFGGTGLGLALVKQWVELHKGSIEVSSQPGQGSTFTLSLPIKPTDNPSPT